MSSKMSAPVMFNLPLWKGEVSQEDMEKVVAKFYNDDARELAHCSVGDFVYLEHYLQNGKILKLDHNYHEVKPNGFILADVVIFTDLFEGDCTLECCYGDIHAKYYRENVERDMLQAFKEFPLLIGNGNAEAKARLVKALNDKKQVCDDNGQLLPEFRDFAFRHPRY